MKLKREDWFSRKLRHIIYRIVGIKFGPAMLQIRGEWLYIGPEGNIWRLHPTGHLEYPLDIIIEHR